MEVAVVVAVTLGVVVADVANVDDAVPDTVVVWVLDAVDVCVLVALEEGVEDGVAVSVDVWLSVADEDSVVDCVVVSVDIADDDQVLV